MPFQVQLEPTSAHFDIRLVDGREMPTRIWKGITNRGTPIEAYVFCITPTDRGGKATLKFELPEFMTTDTNHCLEVDTSRYHNTRAEDVRSMCLHLFGREATEEDFRLVQAFNRS